MEEAFEAGKIDVLGLAEVRREGDVLLETKKGIYFAILDKGEGKKEWDF